MTEKEKRPAQEAEKTCPPPFRWSVRLAQIGDEAAVRALVQAGMRDYAVQSGLTPELAAAKLSALTEAEEILRADLRAGCVLVCYVDRVLVGTLRLKALPEKLRQKHGDAARYYRLLTRFAIHPQYRAMGLGSAVLRAALRWSAEKGVLAIYLYTALDNKSLFAFYQSFGFSSVQVSFNRGYARALLLAQTPALEESWPPSQNPGPGE